MSDYNHYANMSSVAKDQMCEHGTIKKMYEKIKFSNGETEKSRTKSSLKRTESKMEDNPNGSDVNSEVESGTDDVQKHQSSALNRRGNKAPRTDSFVIGRTIRSSVHGHNKMEKDRTRHSPSQQGERMSEKRNDKRQMSNLDDHQIIGNVAYGRTTQNNHEQVKEAEDNNEIHVSKHAMKFAVEDRLPPIKIKCDPELKSKESGDAMIKEYLKYIEKNFRKLNPRFNQPLGFDHFMVDNYGSLVCYTNYIELFIFMCDISNYPEIINNIKVHPILPARLPARNAIILKFIDNNLSFEEIKMYVKEKLESVYSMEEMLGTFTYRSRHIRIDLLSKEEYNKILNSGKFVLGGHLYEVDEYLPSPRILICNKCNTPGHVKKNCSSTIEVCRRCGRDRNDGADHKVCCVKCHHCGDNHESTNFKCKEIAKFRQELLRQLKSNTHLLPPHVQFYIPQRLREQKGKRILINNNVTYQGQNHTRHVDPLNMNTQNFDIWPGMNGNESPSTTTITTPIWNSEIKKLQDELNNLKQEHENQVKKLNIELIKHTEEMVHGLKLLNLKIMTQTEAITDIYTTVSDILPPIIQSIQTLNVIVKEMNDNTKDVNDRRQKEIMFISINDSVKTSNNRLLLLTVQLNKIKMLMDKQNDLMLGGMISTVSFNNEQ